MCSSDGHSQRMTRQIYCRISGAPSFCLSATRLLVLAASFGCVLTCKGVAETTPSHWVVSWADAVCGPPQAGPQRQRVTIHDETIREIVHLTAGGQAVRIRFSNAFGKQPLTLHSVNLSIPLTSGTIDPTSRHILAVGGNPVITIPPKQTVTTDVTNLNLARGSDIAVSFYVAANIVAPAVHYVALQTSYTADGDQAMAPSLREPSKSSLKLILSGVDVESRVVPYAIAAIGSSTTDGVHSTPDQNRRWTDDLFRRFTAERGDAAPSVVNLGISGNRVLHDGHGDGAALSGEAALTRFSRDVLTQPGVKYVIAFEGGNDIRLPGSGAIPITESVTAQQLASGFRAMEKLAHEHRMKFIVATITPFEHSIPDRPQDPRWERTRLEFNDWVRHSKEIDGIIDFDLAIRDPSHPSRILADYDSGDHLHPNDAGYQAMADIVDLSLFQ